MESFKQYTPIFIILLNRTILQYIFQIIFENAINIAAYDKLPEEERKGKFVIGELYKSSRPEYTEEYQKIIDSFTKGV